MRSSGLTDGSDWCVNEAAEAGPSSKGASSAWSGGIATLMGGAKFVLYVRVVQQRKLHNFRIWAETHIYLPAIVLW